jgi:hypothetical protein
MAPIVYMFFNFMYLSNLQIFDNVTINLNTISDVVLSGHKVLLTNLSQIKYDQSFPALCMLVVLLGLIPCGSVVASIMDSLFPGVFRLNFKVDEDLKNYFTALEE